MILNVKAGQVWLRPLPVEERLPILKDRCGMGFAILASALQIVHVAYGGPAALSGWQVGDLITKIDGHPIDRSYTRDGLWRWRYGAPGTFVNLNDAEGQVRRLRLADYY
jgi:C-terminal processing protease CtpA/Prc